jgi:hypothetical protein
MSTDELLSLLLEQMQTSLQSKREMIIEVALAEQRPHESTRERSAQCFIRPALTA